MNIEHKTTPIEHWIVDGKAYRLATEQDVGKGVYRSDRSIEDALSYDLTMPLEEITNDGEFPFFTTVEWKYAYIQDDSLLTTQRTPVPALGDGWFLLTAEDGDFMEGDKVTVDEECIKGWVDPTLGSYSIKFWLCGNSAFRAARYFGPAKEPEPAAEVQPHTKPIDWTKPVRTKGTKKPVRILCTDGPGNYPVIGILEGDVDFWDLEGNLQDDEDENWCLENAPQRIQREYWVNVYKDHIGGQCKTQAIAEDMRENGCLACVKITIDCEEGEGL